MACFNTFFEVHALISPSVTALIAAGADVAVLCPEQHSALDYAIASKTTAVVDALRLIQALIGRHTVGWFWFVV